MDWKALELAGERVEIEWRCGKAAELERANKLAAAANDIVIELPGAIVADLTIRLSGDRLSVKAVLLDGDG
jgi:hypothetical protein